VRLARIRLANVRCHHTLEVELGAGVNVVVGGNGVGKSSLLEAVCLALQGYSPRTHRVTDCIGVDEDHLRIEALLAPEPHDVFGGEGVDRDVVAGVATEVSTERSTLAAVALSREGERRYTVDGRRLETAERWAALAPVRTFFPDDLRLVKGSPRRRRSFVDDLIGARDAKYVLSVGRYTKALSQRNALLQRGDIGSQHDPWEVILAGEGVAIVDTRARELAAFAPLYARVHAHLSGGIGAGVKLLYRTNVGELTVDEYRETLAEQRVGDRRRTFTHSGPHRDDVRFMLDGVDLREAGSQGEQRTALLALVLGAAEYAASSHCRPILLLDDVMSELDYNRRRALVSLLAEDGQSILTTTDLHHFEEHELERFSVITLGPRREPGHMARGRGEPRECA